MRANLIAWCDLLPCGTVSGAIRWAHVVYSRVRMAASVPANGDSLVSVTVNWFEPNDYGRPNDWDEVFSSRRKECARSIRDASLVAPPRR